MAVSLSKEGEKTSQCNNKWNFLTEKINYTVLYYSYFSPVPLISSMILARFVLHRYVTCQKLYWIFTIGLEALLL